MKIKTFTSWFKGLIRKERTETRIPDEALLKINNGNIDPVGRMSIRPGYEHWSDIELNNSITSSDGEPNVSSASIDFQNKVQGMYYFVDIANVQYVFVVTNGKVYAEIKDGVDRTWILLNPVGVINFVSERTKEIKMISYLDTVFFNDFENNVYMYNSQHYNEGGWIITGNRFIYFAGEKIYIRSYTDFSSTSEDITIENVAANLNGKSIYDGLLAISFIPAAGGEVDLADVNLGYAVRAGSATAGYFYYVLSNGKNEATNDSCYLIKFNERFIAKDYIVLPMDTNGEIVNFSYYDGDIYIWCTDGQIEVIDEDNLSNSPINSGDVTSMVAPSPDGTVKQYALTANDKGIFLYTTDLPTKTDWWQPIFFNDFNFDDSADTGLVHDFSGITADTYDVSIGQNVIDQNDINIQNDFYKDEIRSSVGNDNYSWLTNGSLLTGPGGINPWQLHTLTFISYFTPGAVLPEVQSIPPAPGVIIKNDFFYTKTTSLESGWPSNDDWSTSPAPANATLTPGQTGRTSFNVFLDQKDVYQGNIISEKVITKIKLLLIDFLTSVTLLPDDEDLAGTTDTLTGADFYVNSTLVETGPGSGLYDITAGSQVPSVDISNIINKDASSLDLTNRKISCNIHFGYDKDGAMISDIQIWSSYDGQKLTLNTASLFFYLEGAANYNNQIFSSMTSSNNVLLVGLDTSGNILTEDYTGPNGDKVWRWVLPLGKTADLKNALPIQSFKNSIGEYIIYFGNSMDNGTNGLDNGYYTSLNLTDFSLENTELKKADRLMLLQGDYLNRWGLRQIADSTDQIRIGSTWDWDNGIHQHPSGVAVNNYTDFSTFNSNLIFHTLKIVQDTPLIEIDQLKPLGVPKQPILTMDNDDLSTASTFRAGDIYRYFSAYQFNDGSTTDLSPVSEEFLIPDINTIQTVTSFADDGGGDLEATLNSHGYTDGEIVRFTNSGGALPTGLAVDTDYYIVNSAANTFELSLTAGGTPIVYTDAGSGTTSVREVSNVPVKIIISELNLLNAQGVQIYDTDDIDEIQIYRSKKGVADADFADPSFLAKLEKAHGDEHWHYQEANKTVSAVNTGTEQITVNTHGYSNDDIVQFDLTLGGTLPSPLTEDTEYYVIVVDANNIQVALTAGGAAIDLGPGYGATVEIYKTFLAGTYDDNVGTISYNPFTKDNVKTYPCKDIVVHKNRFILINKTNEINSNIIHYSDLDNAEALPPSNIRDIESGDGDLLYGAISVGDYLYLFKEFRIYAILGDVATGQLIDPSKTIGTAFPRTIVAYNNNAFFMNRTGIFIISGPSVKEINVDTLDDLFNKNAIDSIDFSNCQDNAFGYVDVKNKLLHFYVPKKVAGASQVENNFVIIYDLTKNLFTTYSYFDNFFKKIIAKDIISNENIELTTGYNGNIFKSADTYADNGNDILFEIWLKSFNAKFDFLKKHFKFVKLFGNNIDSVSLDYDIDSIQASATPTFRTVGDYQEGLAILNNPGFSDRIVIKLSATSSSLDSSAELIEEFSGATLLTEEQQVLITEHSTTNSPVSFDEVMLGLEPLRGAIR